MADRKGIILAGGAGTRLDPLTKIISKQLLPIYNKPLIYYPLSTLLLTGIKEILIISTPQDIGNFERLLGDGSQFGIKLEYAIQPKPEGLAQAFLIAEPFLKGAPSCLILGDNIFYGHGLSHILIDASEKNRGATLFGYHVEDPERYGVATFDATGKVTSIVEKPEKPLSSIAVTGLYFYDSTVVDKVKNLKPSARGELEITDLNNVYLREDKVNIITFNRGFAWFDTGTFESMLEASTFIRTVEHRQNLMVGLVHEIAFKLGYISREQLLTSTQASKNSPLSKYLEKISHDHS